VGGAEEGGWLGLKSCLDTVEKRKILPWKKLNPNSWGFIPVAQSLYWLNYSYSKLGIKKRFFFAWLVSLKEDPGLIPPWKLLYPKLNNSSHFKFHSKNWQAGKWTCSTSLKFYLYKILLHVDSPFMSKLGHTSWLFMTFKMIACPKIQIWFWKIMNLQIKLTR
jgi:hypothetical protein